MGQHKSTHKAMHPGAYVKQTVIPEGMTVTKAAKLLGVGRPALSNFLNGNAELSPEMAVRLERAFGADSVELIELQARFNLNEENVENESVVSGVYAPELARIRTAQIHAWADKKNARHQLPALVRRLVHSTGLNLTRVRFGAFDNAEDRGLDGRVETSTATSWIPGGESVWQVSCRKDVSKKAEEDYIRGMELVPAKEMSTTTFVFVTAREWTKREEWEKEKIAIGHWKDVRAYDASDLEQWLEQSAAAQIWFAERIGRSVSGYRSIEQCWVEWTRDCEPSLWPALFAPTVKRFAKEFGGWLSEKSDRPFILAADSQEEALAYLRCLAESLETDPPGLTDRMIVFDTPQALERLESVDRLPIIAIAPTPRVERKIGFLRRPCRRVIIRPRNSVYGDPDIALDRLDFMDFHKALEPIGYGYDEIEKLARESACSPTILRRRVSKIPEVQTPSWAGDAKIARKLIPASMVGAWNSAAHGDRGAILSFLRGDDYASVEVDLAQLLDRADPPLWSAGGYQGVVSRIDTLFGIASFVTRTDLDNFFAVAKDVLFKNETSANATSESVLAAGAPQDAPSHSDALRSGIRETLILLAVYGKHLFDARLAFDAEARVADFVEDLLGPFNRDTFLLCANDLPDYAEAAPDVVLSLLEKNLHSFEPVVTAGSSIFSPSLRTPLLWALQILAWNPSRFVRVVYILANLCKIAKTDTIDNWSPKPEETLASLFRYWWPQTAAPLEMRVSALKYLCSRHSTLGWSLCIDQLESMVSGSANHRSRWRDDKASAMPQVAEAEQLQFVRESTALVLDWQEHGERTLGDLVEHLEHFNEEDQLKVWDLIDRWTDSSPPEDERAILRQRINGSAKIRRNHGLAICHPERERAASHALSPQDKASRQAWLFASYRVDLPPDGSDGGNFDYKRNEKRLRGLRVKALQDIWEERGLSGVHRLVEDCEKTSGVIGELMSLILAGQDDEAARFGRSCLDLATADASSAHNSCLEGFLRNVNRNIVTGLIDEAERSGQMVHFTKLLLSLSFRAENWRRLDAKPSETQNSYWKRVEPRTWSETTREEINESVDRLLAVDRPNAAFRAALVAWDQVDTFLLVRLLGSLPDARTDEFLNDPMTDEYNISMAFDELDRRPGVTIEEKARLEYAHITRLDRSKYGIPNIEKYIAESPRNFALAIACVYKRADGAEDPPELNFGDPERIHAAVDAARTLLGRVNRIPGSDEKGNVNAEELKVWVDEVRSWCTRYDRRKIADDAIGSFMARAHADEDGIWPCRPVCEVLESLNSDEVDESFVIGALNRRGVYMRGRGGDKEREHEERYRTWSAELAEYPRVSRSLSRIATYYENEAGRQDTETELMRRLSV
ncbi:MAG: HigA family addiction module antitoxin [Gemmatimonadota bacterium]|nr:HigA family addiction module antitoxin [Gemmatimonadota bacterium]